ncbi:hypothetical protein AMIS_25740 [Actinoplanes missouriensis 431]|uniref:Uncharacterized protein n=1 Tax=Actinoplanes missouriensis (strain ATCC 14538 / DSM 43046 / CBS 188.64 / JCM 3121 / NBRC 102363 / NCIMB 12654 / NRRL B-3342 / UNCC 431) TaxID=512565 RepID=I0H457_ACTM4|nr:hypothetical protein [Actinoplanes missouriensis]BAL87794.1 hypothetical protein AMIS_25740 [Actinoplanes missouriensis 431]
MPRTTKSRVPPAAQRGKAQRAHAKVVSGPGAPHLVLASHPGITTARIERAARETE